MAQKVPPQVLMIVAGVIIFGVAIAGAVVATVMGSMEGVGSPTQGVNSLLESPAIIATSVGAELDEDWQKAARKLTIGSNAELMLENEAGVVRRYTIYTDGNVLRRGGAYRVAAEPFDFAQLKLDKLPAMLRRAEDVTGTTPREVVVGRDEIGVLLWRVVMNGGKADVYFDEFGEWEADPDGVR